MDDFVLRVLRATAPNNCDDINWRTDGEYAPVSFFVNCNDLFWWGTADCEQVTPENIHILEQSYKDCYAVDNVIGECYASSLFCCRVRKLRPQGCCYPSNKKLWPLFNECGPEREINICNPYYPGKESK